jgi:hypothetical protein
MVGHFSISLVCNFRTDFHLLWPPKWAVKGDKSKIGNDLTLLMDPNAKSNTDKKLDQMSSALSRGFRSLFGASAEDDASEDEAEKEKENKPDA